MAGVKRTDALSRFRLSQNLSLQFWVTDVVLNIVLITFKGNTIQKKDNQQGNHFKMCGLIMNKNVLLFFK